MNCICENCSIKGEYERFVSFGLYDIKYAGITSRILDSINDGKGLIWSCLKCRSTEVKFYTLFQLTRDG